MTKRFPLVLVNGYPQEIAATDRVANATNWLEVLINPQTRLTVTCGWIPATTP